MATGPRWESDKGAHPALGRSGESAGLNERLLDAILSISRCGTLEEALESLLDAALDVTKMEGGGVYLVEDEVAVLRYHRGLPEPFIREVTHMPLAPLPIDTLLEQREPIEVTELSEAIRELARRHGIRHAFAFPLRARGTLFGFLNVGSTRPEPPAKADIQALWVLVNEIEFLFFRLYSEKALRESEQRYKSLWESALDGVALHELLAVPLKGRFLDVNEWVCRTLGYSREEILKLSPFDIMTEEQRKVIPALSAQVRQFGRMSFETTFVTRDGRHIPVEINANIIQLGGRPVVLSVVRDITERKRIQEMLQQTNEQLEKQVQARTNELNRTMDELERRAQQLRQITLELSEAEERERRRLAEFLHDDLQQTLAAAKFQLSILGSRIEGDQPAEETLEQVKKMLRDAIEKSRNLSHELGPPVLYHGDLDAIFEWLAGQMESKHGLIVHVEIRDCADSSSGPVRNFLYRAAREILFNTVKHAQVGEARLRLQCVRGELWLTISDKGRGFDPTSLAKTAGFGLSTIRERAELLGGRMGVKSAPGRGSIFFIRVPDVGA